jgi:hypothetical protein
MRRIRSHLTFANVASAIALFVALSGGTAIALGGSNTVFTDDIANDTQAASGGNPAGGLVAADLRPNSVGSSEVTNESLTTSDIKNSSLGNGDFLTGSVDTRVATNNSLTGNDVADGSIASGDLAPSARGARAYGRVEFNSSLSRSKNVVSVSKPPSTTGVYCITLAAGIDPASAVLVVGPDYSNNGTSTAFDTTSVVEWDASAVTCGSQSLEVRTFVYDGDPLDNNDGTGDTAGGDSLTANDEPFAFVVP